MGRMFQGQGAFTAVSVLLYVIILLLLSIHKFIWLKFQGMFSCSQYNEVSVLLMFWPSYVTDVSGSFQLQLVW